MNPEGGLSIMDEAAMRPGTAVAADGEKRSASAKTRGQAERIRIEQHSASGLLWLIGWLFTIGLLHLPFWKGVLAVLVWPYYLGSRFSSLLP
jgi:hypothetical protein